MSYRLARAPKQPTMHSSLVRIQNTFGFFTTVLSVLAAFIALSDLISPRAPSGTLKTTNVQV